MIILKFLGIKALFIKRSFTKNFIWSTKGTAWINLLYNGNPIKKIYRNRWYKRRYQGNFARIEGNIIINFSNYVDEIIDNNQINQILNLLTNYYLKEMNDIRYRLSKYNKFIKFFDKEFEIAKK